MGDGGDVYELRCGPLGTIAVPVIDDATWSFFWAMGLQRLASLCSMKHARDRRSSGISIRSVATNESEDDERMGDDMMAVGWGLRKSSL